MPYKKKDSLFSKAMRDNKKKDKKGDYDELLPFDGPSEPVKIKIFDAPTPMDEPIKSSPTETQAPKPAPKIEKLPELTKMPAPKAKPASNVSNGTVIGKLANALDQKRVWTIVLSTLIAIAVILAGVFAFFSIEKYQGEIELKEGGVLSAMSRVIVPSDFFATSTHDFTYVNNLKAIKLTPGVDFYTESSATADSLGKEIDALITKITELKFNGILLDTRLNDSVVFKSSTLKSTEVDVLSMVIEKARAANLSISAIYNATGVTVGETTIADYLSPESRLSIFAGAADIASYKLDSILIDDYYGKRDSDAYAKYMKFGSAQSFDEWIYSNTFTTVKGIRNAIETSANSMPTGLLIKDVWEDVAKNDKGSKTESEFTAYSNGYVDTKKLVEEKAVHFASLEIDTTIQNTKKSYKEILGWWSPICEAAQSPFYVIHRADLANKDEFVGWNRTDQLAQQVIVASEFASYKGSAFNGLQSLVDNKETSTDILLGYYDQTYKPEDVMQGIEITLPEKQSTITYEENAQFRGKYDPNQTVTINGKIVEPSTRGGFSVWVPLEVGKNSIVIEHKGEKVTYQVERKVIIFKEWGPTKDIKVAGSSQLELSVTGYRGSKISASLNGQTVQLTETDRGDQSQLDSGYVYYVGSLTMPKAKAKEYGIGSITFNGSFAGYKEQKAGSKVTVDKIPDEVDPDSATNQVLQHAVVNRSYAYVSPFNTMPAYPTGGLYQLPEGTQDIVTGVNGSHVNLRSGKTVRLSDVELVDIPFVGNNSISEFKAGVEGNNTVIRATMGWKSPISVNPSPYVAEGSKSYSFAANTVTVYMDYMTTHAKDNFVADMSTSPIFSGITVERVKNTERNIWQYKITMPLRSPGKYYGVHATYEGNTLVLSFNHPPQSGSLSGLTIMVDPGHGGKDYGTMAGRDVVEKNVNLPMANALKAALESKGANVIMSRTDDTTIEPDSRTRIFNSNSNIDLLISVHHNSAGANQKPNGIEVFYNTPFSQPLSAAVNRQVSNYMTSRGSKWYNFFQIRDNQYPAILIEYAFLSNPSDEQKALDPGHQATMAEATAQGVVDYFNR